jgi:hypothetical protein
MGLIDFKITHASARLEEIDSGGTDALGFIWCQPAGERDIIISGNASAFFWLSVIFMGFRVRIAN